MKMTKNWKRFWTLDRHHAEGFTLVELIVVIAILAILAGVAVPAYSGYITEANKTADRQLVRDIEQALMMGYYQGVIQEGGMVVLDQTGNGIQNLSNSVAVSDAAGEAVMNIRTALNNAFGANSNELALKGEWKGNVGQVYQDFANSSFNNRQDALLKDIQILTGAVGTFLDKQGEDFMFFVGGTDWEKFEQKHSVDMTKNGEVANSTAVFVAETTKNKMSDSEKQAVFVREWCNTAISTVNFTKEDVGMTTLEAMAAHYARAEALAGFIDNNPDYLAKVKVRFGTGKQPEDGSSYATMSAWFSGQGGVSGTDTAAVERSMEALTNNFKTVLGTTDGSLIIGDYTKAGGQGEKDAKAYLSMMGAIADNSDKLMAGKGETNLYDGGMASDLLKSYLSAGEALNNPANDIPKGAVAVVITIQNGRCTVVTLGMDEK